MESLNQTPEISENARNPSSLKRAISMIALVTAAAASSACEKEASPEDLKRLEEAERARDEAHRELEEWNESASKRREADKRAHDKSLRKQENYYKTFTPQEALKYIEEAKQEVIRAQSGDDIDRELAKEDLEEARKICRLSRQGYFERSGKYPSPDVDCDK